MTIGAQAQRKGAGAGVAWRKESDDARRHAVRVSEKMHHTSGCACHLLPCRWNAATQKRRQIP